jgi:transaldolase
MKPIFWLDNFSHNLVNSNELPDIINQNNISGLTSNPTILANAIKNDNYYQQKLLSFSRLNKETKYNELVFPDIAKACDMFLPLYESSKHQTGFVSLELDPKYTFNVNESINSAIAINNTIDKPNLMIKVPASSEGIIVMEELIKLGINVNVTLIFNLEQVQSVWQAYINAINYRHEKGLPLTIRAVASFFISRLDTIADTMLPENLQAKAAINLAISAYEAYKQLFSNSNWQKLANNGAIAQTLLWASVGVKNPQYAKDKYIKELYLPDTIFTIPPNLVKNYEYQDLTVDNIKQSKQILENIEIELKKNNTSIAILTKQLFADAVHNFQQSFQELISIL